MEGEKEKKILSSKASDWNHPGKIAQIEPGRETQTDTGSMKGCVKRELEDPEMSVDRPHSNLQHR